MKKLIGIILLVICSLNLMSKAEEQVFYYSTLKFVETPLSYLEGSVPLKKDVALNRNHYRFVYDEAHQLKSVAFYNGETPRKPNHTANLFMLSHQIKFSYTDSTEHIYFYDREGKETAVLGNCRSFSYTIDQRGYRKSLHFLDQDENRITNSWGIYQYQWTYQDDGSVIEERQDQAGERVAIRPGFEFYRLKLNFNHLGQIARMQNIDENGNLVENTSGASQDVISTNAEGNFLTWNVLNNSNQLEKGNGPNVAMGKQAFNDYGYEQQLIHFDEKGNRIYSAYGICESRTTFDDFGNLSERRFYDKEGKEGVHLEAGYHKLKVKWSKDGNRRNSITYFNQENQAVHHKSRGYHKVKYTYNSQNRLVKISYLDMNEELINRTDNGVAVIEFKYDSNGKVSNTKKLNKNGKEI